MEAQGVLKVSQSQIAGLWLNSRIQGQRCVYDNLASMYLLGSDKVYNNWRNHRDHTNNRGQK